MTRRLLVLTFSLTAVSCIAFVDNTSYATTCNFDGSGSNTCGKCIAAHCQPKVDACCGANNCKGSSALTDLDTCGVGGDCTSALAETGSSEAQAMSACIKASCGTQCLAAPPMMDGGTDAADAGAPASCTEGSDDLSCKCVTGSSNTTACNPEIFAEPAEDVLCCASSTWPNSGGCVCVVYTCAPNMPAGCICAFDTVADDGSYKPSNGCDNPGDTTGDGQSGCCFNASSGECYCATTDLDTPVCESGDEQVPNCLLGKQITCNAGDVTATSCR